MVECRSLPQMCLLGLILLRTVSRSNAFVTGQVVSVNGGSTML
jgi:hypothetical protein